jgi:hypothetical protein
VVEEQIAEIGIEDSGSLFVTPAAHIFSQIHLAAMQVSWDGAKSRLVSPPPEQWPYPRWFEQIVGAVALEYKVLLRIGPSTIWSDVPADVRAAIEATDAEAAAEFQTWSTPLAEMRRHRAAERWVGEWQKNDTLERAAHLWEEGRFADYARLLAPIRSELSPAQIKRLDIAKRRSGII